MFLEILQNEQENTCVRVSFNKVLGPRPQDLFPQNTSDGYFCISLSVVTSSKNLTNYTISYDLSAAAAAAAYIEFTYKRLFNSFEQR